MLDKISANFEVGLEDYFKTLNTLLRGTIVTNLAGAAMPLDSGCEWVRREAHVTHDQGGKLMFVGNGGSAGIASHLAIDFSKNGGLRATAFNDAAALTCVANDLGYENVFARQIDIHGRPGDLLIAISASGQSPNMLKAIEAARSAGCKVVTFSGFAENNRMRAAGDMNFYVSSPLYGLVEIAHLALCHAILDIDMGWGKTP